MCKKISILFIILSLTACGTTQVAELSTTAVESKIETTTVAETTTIVETSEEIKETAETTAEETTVEETTIPDKWAGYSDEVREIIEKYEGKDYQTSRTITQSELKTLHNAGLYMITADTTHTVDSNSNRKDSGGHNEIMTKEQLEQYIRDNTTVNSSNNNSIMTQALNPSTYAIYDADAGEIARNVRKKIQEGLWEDREAERDKIARMYAKKNTDPNNPAQYINSLGNGNYVVKFGLVVPSEENADYYLTLKGQDRIKYGYTEWMCFKQNNQGRITLVKDKLPRAKYKENTFEDSGEGNVGTLLWVSRTPNEERVNYLGKTWYSYCAKTVPEYYDKCGGTETAFLGWQLTKSAVPYDYTYNKVMEGVWTKEQMFNMLMDVENSHSYKP